MIKMYKNNSVVEVPISSKKSFEKAGYSEKKPKKFKK